VGVGREADMSLTGFRPLWDKILSQNLQAVADQGRHFKGCSPFKGTAYRGVCCICLRFHLGEALPKLKLWYDLAPPKTTNVEVDE
jgi:hypothetical protein